MAQKREWFKDLKDDLQKHRNTIVYVSVLLTLLGLVVGWGLLPDLVTLEPMAEDPLYQPKNRVLLMHLGMGTLFSGLFWKWPRELAYIFGLVLSLLLLFAVLYGNMGV